MGEIEIPLPYSCHLFPPFMLLWSCPHKRSFSPSLRNGFYYFVFFFQHL
jgi:hypothetical protein